MRLTHQVTKGATHDKKEIRGCLSISFEQVARPETRIRRFGALIAQSTNMEEILARLWQDLIERPTGPLALRFYLQPTMAILFAIKDGIKDARQGRPPYLWAILTHPKERRPLLREGWKSIAKIVVLALLLDFIYQLLMLGRIYIGELLVVAIILAVLPYALLRGPVNRLLRHRYRSPTRIRDKAA